MHGFHRSGSRSGGRGWDGLSQLWPSAQLTIDPTQERGSEGGAANRGGGNEKRRRDELEGGAQRWEEERDGGLTWVMGGFGGPGAMKATVEAVALFATTGSLIVASTIEMFLRDRTVQTPARKPH